MRLVRSFNAKCRLIYYMIVIQQTSEHFCEFHDSLWTHDNIRVCINVLVYIVYNGDVLTDCLTLGLWGTLGKAAALDASALDDYGGSRYVARDICTNLKHQQSAKKCSIIINFFKCKLCTI